MTPALLKVRLLTGLLWALVAAGPALGAAALLRPPPPAAGPAAPPAPPPGVTGLAELAVRAAATTLPDDIPAQLLPAAPRPPAALADLGAAERAAAAAALEADVAVAAVAVEPAGPGRWGVTVAALRAGSLEGWQVTIADGGAGPVVETVPALVGLPAPAGHPATLLPPLAAPDPEDQLAQTAGRFLAALLAGDGEVGRYARTDADIPVPAEQVAAVELRRAAAAPLEGHGAVVLAEVRLTRADGAVHLAQYPLLLAPAGGRWEVQRILPALPLAAPEPAAGRPS